MIIKKINIKNYRQFINSEINFENDLTFLAGANNSGKTSLVEFLNKIFTSETKVGISSLPVQKKEEWANDFLNFIFFIFDETKKEKDRKEKFVELFSKYFLADEDLDPLPEGIKIFKLQTPCALIEVSYDISEDFSLFADYIMEVNNDNTSFYYKYDYDFDLSAYKKHILTTFEELSDKLSNLLVLSNQKIKVKIKLENETEKISKIKEEESLKKQKEDIDSIQKELESILHQEQNNYFRIKEFLLRGYWNCLNVTTYFCNKDYSICEKMNSTKQFRDLFNFMPIKASRPLVDQENDNVGTLRSSVLSLTRDNAEYQNKTRTILEEVSDSIHKSNIQQFIEESSTKTINDTLKDFSSLNDNKYGELFLNIDISTDNVNSFIQSIIEPQYKIDGYYLKEFAQGLGVSNLVFIELEAKKFINNIDPQKVNLFIIEEPESHMHPQMQKTLLSFLNKHCTGRTFQGLVTTHSKELLTDAKFEKIRVIRQVKLFKNKIFDLNHFYNNICKNEIDKNLCNILFGINFSDLVFSDCVIAFEGDTERMYIKQVIKNHYEKLSKKYISYVQVGGAYAHNYYELLNFLNMKTLILTDIDYEKKDSYSNYDEIIGLTTTNASLKYFYKKATEEVAEEIEVKVSDIYNWDGILNDNLLVKTQKDKDGYTRTLEEAMLYNLLGIDKIKKIDVSLLKTIKNEKKLKIAIPKNENVDLSMIQKSNNENKTNFMYSLLLGGLEKDVLPNYIKEGLEWLEK